SFCYRLYIVGDAATPRDTPPRSRCWAICFVSSIPSLAVVVSYYFHPVIVIFFCTTSASLDRFSSGLPDMSDVRAALPIFYYVFCAPTSMTLIFLVRRRLVACIATVNEQSHFEIERYQALTYQMLLPSGLLIGATIWILDLSQIYCSLLIEHSIMVVVSLFALASPLINLYFLPPYRSLFLAKP
ncbi:hypothetical protein PFISCL1PPCAC_13562, partial [Pristionchus fissidentatus]